MRQWKKRAGAMLLALTMVLGIAAVAAGTEKTISVVPMTMTINGQAVTPTKSDGTPAEVFAYDGATYVPLRYLSELLGIKVDWDAKDNTTAKLVGDNLKVPAAGGDGTYTGTGMGFGGEITATVTVSGGKVTACTLKGDKETPAIGGAALEKLQAQVIAAGGAAIDGVSGATMTSGGVKAAVTDAMNKATGAAAATVKMKPGTYQASAFGFSLVEKVPVSVTVSEDKITDITISEECSDTTIILRNVQELLVPRILASQSVAVDAITGATSTSNAVKTAVTDCLKQALVAGGSSESAVSAFQTAVAKANAGKKETKTGYDVIIVGVGGAGTMAAVSAAEQGLKVLAVEKAGKVGGTSVVTSAPMSVNPEKFQKQYNDGKDYMDKAEMRTEWLKYTTDKNGVQKAKSDLVDVMLDYSGETLDWLVYDHNFTFSTPGKGMTEADKYLCVYNYVGGREVISNDRRIGAQAMYDSIMAEYAKMGGELMLETEGTEVIMENGKAVGIKAVDLVDGTEYTIKGKSVVLCTGGFAGNVEMVDKYVSQNEFYDFSTPGGWKMYGMYQNDGKMLSSAIANGAATYNIDMPPMVHNTATRNLLRDFPVTPASGKNALSGRSNTQSINDIPQIMSQVGNILVVGNEGKRIVDESKMGQLGSWINGREFYAIWSSTQIDKVKENGFKYVTLSRYLGQGGVNKETPMPQIYEVLDAAVKADTAYKADTLEELAEMIGVPAKNLVETVAKYNEACKTGEDKEFGKGADYLDAIGEGPYYCIVGAPYCYATCGGLDVNANLNVLNTKGKPIKGLYACGEDSLGCLMTDDKAYVTYGGAAQGWALTSGYYVGKVLGKELGK